MNIQKVKNILQENRYPKHFIDKIVTELLQKIRNRNVNTIEQTKKKFRISYIPELSQKIKRTLKRNDKEIVFYNMKTVGMLNSHIKDPIKKHL